MTRSRLPSAVLAACVTFALSTPAVAAEQFTADADDAYTLASGQSDIRLVEFATEGSNVTVTVRVENSTQFAAFTWFDVDRNGRADYSLVMDGGSGTSMFDVELYATPASTAACQLYDPATPPLLDQQIKYTVDANNFALLTISFPDSLIGGAGAWTWAAFGLTSNGLGPPGWDYAPDEANPDGMVPQPASRACSIDQVAGSGISIDLAAGVEFPTPAPGNATPVAAFGFAPSAPLSTDPVTFTSSSTDSDGTLASQRWDLDGDGLFDDAAGAQATTSFATKGPHTVGLLVQDEDGAVATASQVVQVGNRQPTVSFIQGPEPVRLNEPMTIRSTSTDDGLIVGYDWDLDDDGQYDDATGLFVTRSFPRKGRWMIGLRVTDDDGAYKELRAPVFVSNSPPIARLVVTPPTPTVGVNSATLDASGSTDPDGDPLQFRFDRGRDGHFTAPTASPYLTFSPFLVRRLHVRVDVSDNDGGGSLAELDVDLVPPPISFAVLGPDPETVVLSDAVEIYGRWAAHENRARLCVTLGTPAEMPAECDHRDQLDPDGTWGVRLSGLVPGVNQVTAFLTDFHQTRRIETTVERVSTTSGLDLRAGTIEVTQGSQFLTLPNPRDRTPGAERVADYNGVVLARGGNTYARVFANARSLARGNLHPSNVTVTLTGYDGSRLLPGGPLTPIARPGSVTPGPTIGADPNLRANPSGAYLFELPDAWTRLAHLRLDATVDPAEEFPECETCRRDNTFSLREIVFREAPRALIAPVRMAWIPTGGGPIVAPPAAEVVFDALQRLSPGGALATTVLPYFGQPLNISDIANSTMSDDDKNWRVFDRAVRWSDGSHTFGAHPVGVNTGVARGLAGPALLIDPPRTLMVMVAESMRPLTSVAHELFHAYGAGHASTCTSGSDPRVFLGFGIDDWPPDQRGQLNGYALDLRPGSGGRRGPFRILPPTNYDFMSYCANSSGDPDSWLSARNWNRRMNGPLNQPYRTASASAGRSAPTARAAQAGGALLVTGAIDAKGVATILRVEPTSAPASAPARDAAFAVAVRGAGGAVVGSAGVAPAHLHTHEKPGDGGRYFRVVVPGAANAAAVELTTAAGAVLTSRAASATAPTITRVAARVRRGRLRLRWQAADADRDRLTAHVELGSDGSRFRTVALDVQDATSADIPLDGVTGGRKARVRVTVSDGFRAASATSAPFRLPAGKSDARIIDPTPKSVLLSDQAVALRGEALTASGKRLGVTWFAGARRLGRGNALSVRGLRPGRVRLRLVAADGAVATRTVTVRAAAPVLTALRVPRRVAKTAKSVTLRVAANLPATLTLGGRRYSVDRKVRALRVRVGKARALRGRLSAHGKATRVTVSLRPARRAPGG